MTAGYELELARFELLRQTNALVARASARRSQPHEGARGRSSAPRSSKRRNSDTMQEYPPDVRVPAVSATVRTSLPPTTTLLC